MPKETSAGAVIFRQEGSETYYLLLHYQSGHWDFPKGIIEQGEREEETVKREVEEETGLKDIKIIKGFEEKIKYSFKRDYEGGDGSLVHKTVVFYLGETKTKQVKISDEHIGYKWLSYKEALEQLTYKNAKDILKKANDFLVSKKSL